MCDKTVTINRKYVSIKSWKYEYKTNPEKMEHIWRITAKIMGWKSCHMIGN